MATENVTPIPTRPTAPPAEPGALFQPFSWNRVTEETASPFKANGVADFAGTVKDVADGVVVILQILERDEIDNVFADEFGAPLPRLMSPVYAGHLTRLTVAALTLLAASASEIVEICNKAADAQAGGAA